MSIIHRAYKTELKPNNQQRTLFSRCAGVARFAYNWGLEQRIKEYKSTGKTLSAFDQQKKLNAIKDSQFPWMRNVSQYIAKKALQNLSAAYGNFFRKGGSQFPKFKSKHKCKASFRLEGPKIKIRLSSIYLPRIGWVRLKEHGYLPLNAKINSATVSERAGHWFVSVQVEEEISVPGNDGPPAGVDLGLTTFAVCSDGTKFKSPEPLAKGLKKLKRLCRQRSRKKKGSQNREKSNRKLARLYYRIACQRNDFIHKATTKLARTKSAVVVEDLDVSGLLKNRRLSRGISDAGWCEFVRQLEYKCEWYGSRLIKADRFYPSSKTCSQCGKAKGKQLLSERLFTCEYCGMFIDRDLNAARNLLKLHTAGQAEINAPGDNGIGRVAEGGIPIVGV